jgi:urease accessory protein
MPIDPRFLTLTQWLSPAYPMGAFAYSHGLESAVAAGWVTDETSLFEWLEDILRYGSGRSDAAWIWLAFQAEDDVEVTKLDRMARAFCPARERLREAERQGQAFGRVTSEVWDIPQGDFLFPIALGRAAKLVDLDPHAATTLYLQGFLGNLASVAQRLMPFGQVAAQRVLSQLNPSCAEIARIAKTLGPDDISSSAFLSDIAAMQHETLEPRLFQS